MFGHPKATERGQRNVRAHEALDILGRTVLQESPEDDGMVDVHGGRRIQIPKQVREISICRGGGHALKLIQPGRGGDTP